MNRAAAGLLCLLALVLAGCTGVPTSSSPEALGTVGPPAPSAEPARTPTANADPRTIVSEFLTASASEDSHHLAAHGFLTREAAQGWSDTTVTVVDLTRIGNFSGQSVPVSGRKLGTVNADGIYTPALQGGTEQFEFGMRRVSGQWRIDTLQNGIVVDSATFQSMYQQHALYFYDLAEQRLVPDPRYTAISDPALLANWLMAQVAAGPRPELQAAVRTELPVDTDPARVTVTFDAPVKIQIPGAAQLVPAKRDRLAAQIAITLQSVVGGSFSITDNGQAITIPAAAGTRFSASDFASAVAPSTQSPALFYVAPNGRVVDEEGKPLAGRLSSGSYALLSVAIAQGGGGSDDLRVAGTSGAPANARLLVGTAAGGLIPTSVRGPLSRPSWAPGQDEVWVGDGTKVLRVDANGTARAVPVTSTGSAVDGAVTALRFSPDGARVAMVLTTSTSAGSVAQVWVGAVIRTGDRGGQVRVDSLTPISPQDVTVTDVAWNDQLKLFAIGRAVSNGESSVFEVQVDGSLWTSRGIGNLPQAPDSITVAENEVAWVSAGGTVWAQRAGSWASPGVGPTSGTNPVYLE